MLTENLSTLKINRLTQEQYDREKASGTLDNTALYFTPEEEITVPTSLSQLSDDETHRLVTDTDKTAWNAKANVFTIALSDGESGSLTTDKTYNEILEAYNSGKLLRITAEGGMLEGVFLAYAYDTFSFVFITNSTGVYITSNAVGTSPVPAFLPSASFSDKGKILTVDNNGNAVWTEATSSGAEVFLVSFTQAEGSTLDSMSFIADKTYAEIVAAHEAGKIVRCSALGSSFGELVGINSTRETVTFGVDVFSGSFSYIAAFSIDSANKVSFSSSYFYTPQFLQEVIRADAWSDGVYSFESDFPNMLYDIEVELDSAATSEQLEAWSNAKVTSVFETNTMKALGDIPTVDIPVIVKVLFNVKLQNKGVEQ